MTLSSGMFPEGDYLRRAEQSARTALPASRLNPRSARTKNKVALAGRVGSEIEAVLLWEAHGV